MSTADSERRSAPIGSGAHGGSMSSLHIAVGLGPETPCKLAAAPEATSLSPRLFTGTSATERLPL